MTAEPEQANRDAQLARFAQLIELEASERGAALAVMAIDAQQRAELSELLAADAIPDTALNASVAHGAIQAFAPSRTGDRLGPWRVLREIGAGGMGTVFLAERADGTFQQQVAIKLLRGFPTDEGRRRLRQERQVLAQLDHPYIARLIDGGETEDGQPFFVMEYVEGLPVPTYAAAKNLNRLERVELIDRVAEAVSHAHQRLVVHRDLKPSNVLVRDDATPRLLDFGVAKLVDSSAGEGLTSTRVWTPGYASSEQKQGRAITTATDVFALGTLLRELLSGKTPNGPPCQPHLSPVVIDADLAGIINKATSEQAADRYPTIEALRDDFKRWREGRPVRAARDTPWYRVRKFVFRHRTSVGVLVLAIVGLGIFIWRLDVERARARQAEARAAQQRIAAEQSAQTTRSTLDFFGGLIGELSPDGDIDAPITLRRMLERGTDRIARELPKGAPQAPLVNTYLGSIYALLGEPADAEPLFRSGIDAMSAQGLEHGPTFARAALDYANLLAEVGRLPESFIWLKRAAAAYRADPSATNEADATSCDVQAHIFAERHVEAEQDARRGVAQAIAGHANPEAIATLQQQRAVTLNALSRSAEAEATAVDGLARLNKAGLARSMFVYQFEQELGKAQLNLRRPSDALASLDRAREVYVQGRGETGFLLIVLDEWRTTALQDIGRLSEARSLVEQTQARWAKAAGREPDALSRHGLAWAFAIEGDLASAARLSRAILADAQGFTGLTPAQAQHIRLASARIIGLAGDPTSARNIVQAEIERSSPSDSQDDLRNWYLYVGESALEAGDWAKAQRDLDVAAKSIEASDHPTAQQWRLDLARVRGRLALAQAQFDDAERDLSPLLTLQSNTPAYRVAIAALDLAALRVAQGRVEEAKNLVRTHLPILRASVLPTHLDRIRAERLAKKLGLN
jgi:eukaryotic-like serine/threonine-protein kinase